MLAYAVPTGDGADQGPAHIRTDADFQNRALERIRSRFPALNYVGDWHVHPMYLPKLSGTDLHTAKEILSDRTLGRGSLVLLLGTIGFRGSIEIHAFLARLGMSGRLEVDEHPIRCVELDSEEVRDRLSSSLAPISEVLSKLMEPKKSRAGIAEHDRVQQDLDSVRAALGAEIEVHSCDGVVGAEIRLGDARAVAFFPPEYPLGSPQVFRGALENGPLEPVPLLYGWSSIHALADLVESALCDRPVKVAAKKAAQAMSPTKGVVRRIIRGVMERIFIEEGSSGADAPGPTRELPDADRVASQGTTKPAGAPPSSSEGSAVRLVAEDLEAAAARPETSNERPDRLTAEISNPTMAAGAPPPREEERP